MDPLRLVMVTRRFWPLVGRAESVLGRLAVELADRGHRVTVVTAKWQPNWPANVRFHEVPVVRLPCPPRGGFSTYRYVRSLIRWLRSHRKDYDLIYISGLKHEAYAATRAVGRRLPVVLRAERAGREGDCLWQLDARGGRRIKAACLHASAFLGTSRPIVDELEAAGYPRSRIHDLPNGVPILPPSNSTAKQSARRVLQSANASLTLPEQTPLAVYAGRLDRSRRLKYLVAAWRTIVDRWPNARLWLVGMGADQPALLRQIEERNLTGRVLPIGVFHGIEDVLAAADLFVTPSTEPGVSVALLEAMAAGLPVVAADTPSHRSVLTDQQDGLLTPPDDANALATAMFRLIDRPKLAGALGYAARARADGQFSLAKMADRHVSLFQRLIHSDASSPDPVPTMRDIP